MDEFRHVRRHRRKERIDDWTPRPGRARLLHLAISTVPSIVGASTAILASHIPLAEHRWWRVGAWLFTVVGCAAIAGIGTHVALRRLRPLADLMESGGAGLPFSESHALLRVLLWPQQHRGFGPADLGNDLIAALQFEAKWPVARSQRRRREAIMMLVGKELGLSSARIGAIPIASRLFDLELNSRTDSIAQRINRLWGPDLPGSADDQVSLYQLTSACAALGERLDDEAIAAPSGIVRNALGTIIAEQGRTFHPVVVEALRTARIGRITDAFRQNRHIAPAQRTLLRSILSALLAVGTVSVMNLPSPVNASTPTPAPVEISSTVAP